MAGLAAGAGETILHNFASPPKGANPYSAVVRDSSGNLYGAAVNGGAGGAGVVYKIAADGHVSILYNFTGQSDGEGPFGGVILDSAGNLYGTTVAGGAANRGVVYKLDTAGNETVLYSFSGGVDGSGPQSGVTMDAAGNLYGTTTQGGSANQGVVYKLNTAGNETVLHSFTGSPDGGDPFSGVILDDAGDLYGTTQEGGANFGGVVYEISPAGEETILFSFSADTDGGFPLSGVIRDAKGNLYGTASYGGLHFGGVVYKLSQSGQETLLYSFMNSADGGDPISGLVADAEGNLYGTTEGGGTGNNGVVYKIAPGGEESVLYSFPGGAEGAQPFAGLVRGAAGTLYGTAVGGGDGYGVVYAISMTDQETVLLTFPGVTDGIAAISGVIRDSEGNLYGTTEAGGTMDDGTVYEVSATGTEQVLHSFQGESDGSTPFGGVVRDAAGNLYGTTYSGGMYNQGVVWKLSASGEESILHSFTGGADGATPFGGLTLDGAGNLYGAAYSGGSMGVGVVFELDPLGVETVLHNFMTGADGGGPYAAPTLDAAGNVYGTTAFGGGGNGGVVYKIDTSGNETVLYSFTGGADGGSPLSPVTLGAAGEIFGTTNGGGSGFGVVFKLEASGVETVFHSFTGGSDGGNPTYSGVVRNSAGDLYGTTQAGGTGGWGVIYKISPAGEETVIESFDFTDGAAPASGVIGGVAGALFGTTSGGGKHGEGVVFEIRP